MSNDHDTAGDEALGLFKNGLYCAESVLTALAHRQGLDTPEVTAMATGFCSGLSQTAGPCGAVTGAVMGLGLALGRSQPGQPVNRAYEAVQSLMARFQDEFGSTACSELLGCHLGTPEGRQTFTDNKLIKRCADYTKRATELAAELIDETP
jgi:C_GCAxxG_C_C family probable redox protein